MQPRKNTELSRGLETEMEALLACIHCGLCLPTCPTYLHLGDENDSPRGRLYLMRAVAQGRLDPSAVGFGRHIDLCLGCRACETACPSGVPYGHLLQTARQEISHASAGRRTLADHVVRLVLNHVFTSPRRLHILFRLARWLRRIGLIELLEAAGISLLFPTSLRKALAMLMVTKPAFNEPPIHAAAPPVGSRSRIMTSPIGNPASLRTAFFAGCVVRGLFEHTNESTKIVLAKHGYQVSDPRTQVCCGALHAHAGEVATAKKLARRNIDAFEAEDCDAIIVNAAGCGAMLKEYGELLGDDETYRARAQAFSAKVKDITEFLGECGYRPGTRRLNLRVTYDAPCHLYHGQCVTRAPVDLIQQLPGVEFVPMPKAEFCCGSAGIYNLLQAELADQILAEKLESIRSTGAEVLLTGNAGCLMHIASGARLMGLELTVMHPIELIARTY